MRLIPTRFAAEDIQLRPLLILEFSDVGVESRGWGVEDWERDATVGDMNRGLPRLEPVVGADFSS